MAALSECEMRRSRKDWLHSGSSLRHLSRVSLPHSGALWGDLFDYFCWARVVRAGRELRSVESQGAGQGDHAGAPRSEPGVGRCTRTHDRVLRLTRRRFPCPPQVDRRAR